MDNVLDRKTDKVAVHCDKWRQSVYITSLHNNGTYGYLKISIHIPVIFHNGRMYRHQSFLIGEVCSYDGMFIWSFPWWLKQHKILKIQSNKVTNIIGLNASLLFFFNYNQKRMENHLANFNIEIHISVVKTCNISGKDTLRCLALATRDDPIDLDSMKLEDNKNFASYEVTDFPTYNPILIEQIFEFVLHSGYIISLL